MQERVHYPRVPPWGFTWENSQYIVLLHGSIINKINYGEIYN